MNCYEVARWFGIAFFLILILALIIIPVQAAPYVYQGDTVCVDQTIDISGVLGGYTATAYYGRYGEYVDPAYLIDLPISKKGWYNFYLDPVIFEKRLGPWFKFTGNTTGVEHGNTIAFYVDYKGNCDKVNVTNATPTLKPEPTPALPTTAVAVKRFDTDYQVAYGDSLTLPVNTKLAPPRLWVFGRLDKIYNKSFSKQTVSLSSSEVQKLEPGTYTVITQFPGKNTIFEVGYSKVVDVANSKTTEQLTSPWAAIKPVDVFGLQPRMVLTEYRKMMKNTDDVLTEYSLEVANPVLDIVSIDETYDDGKDVLDVRGYTNVAKGTPISFVMDEDDQTVRTLGNATYRSIVQETTPGAWRYFKVLIPINYNQIAVGKHFITAIAPQGGRQTVSFDVYDMPAGQEAPPATIKYVAGNQFIPIVTVTIEIPVPGPTQIVTVKVTPPNEQVYAQQKLAEDKKWEEKKAEYIGWAMLACGGLFLVGLTWYGVRVVKRARLR